MYYERQSVPNSDGTPLFAIDYDKEKESEVSLLIEKKLECKIHHFGRLCPIDFYAVRHGRLVGLIELKSRNHSSSTHSTVFLNIRKWLALKMAQVGLAVPAVYVVRFNDCIMYIKIDDIDTTKIRITGTKKIVKSNTDVEPIIEVPVSSMKLLHMLT
jgi:hypothetical protein